MSFAARLKTLRLRNGESLQELADAIQTSKPHLWELETGKSRNPTKEMLEKLSTHFRVPVAQLMGETSDDEGDAQLGVMFRELRELGERDRKTIEALIQSLRERRAPDK